jgi:hypothetical protein
LMVTKTRKFLSESLNRRKEDVLYLSIKRGERFHG